MTGQNTNFFVFQPICTKFGILHLQTMANVYFTFERDRNKTVEVGKNVENSTSGDLLNERTEKILT